MQQQDILAVISKPVLANRCFYDFATGIVVNRSWLSAKTKNAANVNVPGAHDYYAGICNMGQISKNITRTDFGSREPLSTYITDY